MKLSILDGHRPRLFDKHDRTRIVSSLDCQVQLLGPLQRGEIKRSRAQAIGHAPIHERKTALGAIAVELIIIGGFLLNAPTEAT